jgi:hypothetical protein
MLWNLVEKGIVVLACDALGIGVISTAINVVGVLTAVVAIMAADDPQTEVKNVVKDWAINKVGDRVVGAVIGALV